VNFLPGQYLKQNNVLRMVHLTSAALTGLFCVRVTIFLLVFTILYFKSLD